MTKTDEPFCVIRVQHHTLTIHEYDVTNTISIEPTVYAPFNISNFSVGKERNAIDGKVVVIEDELQAFKENSERANGVRLTMYSRAQCGRPTKASPNRSSQTFRKKSIPSRLAETR